MRRPHTLLLIAGFTVLLSATGWVNAQTPQQGQAKPSKEQVMLQRIYEMRMRFEQERAQRDAEARANVRLQTQGGLAGRADSPTVSGLRQQTNQSLARFESSFRCLDVDVEANSGNTVVICGDNSGDISGRNVSAERDIVTVQGGRP